MQLKQRKLQRVSILKGLVGFCAAALIACNGGTAFAQAVNDGTALGQAVNDVSPASVIYQEDGQLSQELNIPIYSWKKDGCAPRGVVLAVHGLALHGKTFDYLGRTLAEQGYAVFATDMHGYGSYISKEHKYCDAGSCKHKVSGDCKRKTNYDRSYEDITKLARSLRERYPSLPIFGVGESLGGAMCIRLAAQNPDLVDGLILSAPAIKHQTFIVDIYAVADAGMAVVRPRAPIDLTPFVRRFSSDDQRVVEEILNDPMTRRGLTAFELLQASNTIRKTISYVPHIPQDTPVLIIQGSADRCVKAQAVIDLLSGLQSSDQTVKWFPQRGHILLETAFIKPDTMETVQNWLSAHVNSPALQAKCNRIRDFVVDIPKTDFNLAASTGEGAERGASTTAESAD